jgi:hypothetical protein
MAASTRARPSAVSAFASVGVRFRRAPPRPSQIRSTRRPILEHPGAVITGEMAFKVEVAAIVEEAAEQEVPLERVHVVGQRGRRLPRLRMVTRMSAISPWVAPSVDRKSAIAPRASSVASRTLSITACASIVMSRIRSYSVSSWISLPIVPRPSLTAARISRASVEMRDWRSEPSR